MSPESEIKSLIKELYIQIGGNPDDVLPIISIDDGFSYFVSKPSGKTIPIFRRHIDAKNYPEIREALRGLL